MMAPEFIRQVNSDQATKAKFMSWEPMVLQEPLARTLRTLKHLGDYVPEGWDLVETHFVDASGFGEEGEAALTIDQFEALIRADMNSGWAIVEAGQFQVYIGQFRNTESDNG